MLVDKNRDHASHQIILERQMIRVKVDNQEQSLTVQDYAEKLSIDGRGVANIQELFRTGGF
jgi:hypothetical protein